MLPWALLTPEGRAWLSVKLFSCLREEIIESGGDPAAQKVQDFYHDLGCLGTGIDAMHPFFGQLRKYSHDLKEKMSSRKKRDVAELDIMDQDEIDLTAADSWLVAVNRNGVMHPFNKKLSALAQGGQYTRSDVIQLLHYKLALYLPVAQALCRSYMFLEYLDMGNCKLLP